MTVKEFINQVFLKEYAKIVGSGFHYISFALIGLGIEFLGACLDAHEFGKRVESTTRFKLAIKRLFPPGITNTAHSCAPSCGMDSHISCAREFDSF